MLPSCSLLDLVHCYGKVVVMQIFCRVCMHKEGIPAAVGLGDIYPAILRRPKMASRRAAVILLFHCGGVDGLLAGSRDCRVRSPGIRKISVVSKKLPTLVA